MSKQVCRRCLVDGRVQGVYFRASTRQKALELGLGGHANNLPDGRVEVLVCGEITAVHALCAWLRHGPRAARVDQLDCQDIAGALATQDFSTG